MLASEARLFGTQGELQKAIEYANLSLDFSSINNDIALTMADILNQNERWVQALPFWQIAEKNHPDDANVQTQYGYALFKYGSVDQARQHLKKALLIQPTSWRTNRNYSLFLEKYGSIEEYKEHLLNAFKLFPDSMVYARSLGEVALQEQHFQDAEGYLLIVVKNRPTWVKVAIELGDLYVSTGQSEKAVVMYEKLLLEAPQEAKYHKKLTKLLQLLGYDKKLQKHLCDLRQNAFEIFVDVTNELGYINVQCNELIAP